MTNFVILLALLCCAMKAVVHGQTPPAQEGKDADQPEMEEVEKDVEEEPREPPTGGELGVTEVNPLDSEVKPPDAEAMLLDSGGESPRYHSERLRSKDDPQEDPQVTWRRERKKAFWLIAGMTIIALSCAFFACIMGTTAIYRRSRQNDFEVYWSTKRPPTGFHPNRGTKHTFRETARTLRDSTIPMQEESMCTIVPEGL